MGTVCEDGAEHAQYPAATPYLRESLVAHIVPLSTMIACTRGVFSQRPAVKRPERRGPTLGDGNVDVEQPDIVASRFQAVDQRLPSVRDALWPHFQRRDGRDDLIVHSRSFDRS